MEHTLVWRHTLEFIKNVVMKNNNKDKSLGLETVAPYYSSSRWVNQVGSEVRVSRWKSRSNLIRVQTTVSFPNILEPFYKKWTQFIKIFLLKRIFFQLIKTFPSKVVFFSKSHVSIYSVKFFITLADSKFSTSSVRL